LLLAIAAWLRWRVKPRGGPAPHRRDVGCIGPNDPVLRGSSSYITDASAWFADQLLALEPGTQWGGTYASKPGYHNTRSQNASNNYSVVDSPDKGGPGNKAAGYDWTFPEAQSGNYARIATYTSRLLASAQDVNDPRLDGWREFYGQADVDTYVEGWDCRYGYACTSDSSHLWHIHLSESRDQVESVTNKEAMLSVLRGDTVAQWLGSANGDGAVILNCPYDSDRLDIFYVAPDGNVKHNWYADGGMNALWNGTGKSETLGGVIVPGTLSAAWDPLGTTVNIIGLGAPDDEATPHGAGQYWGFTLSKGGGKSGWGSLTGVYGQLPAASVARTHRAEPPPSPWRQPSTWLLVAAVLILAVSLVSLWIR